MRTQLQQSGLPPHLWGELAIYSSLQINCLPTRALKLKIPIQCFEKLCPTHMHPFDFNRLQPFGCLPLTHIQEHTLKLSPTAQQLIFVGLEPGARAARLWDKQTKRILVTGDVKYHTNVFPAQDQSKSPTPNTTLSVPVYFDDNFLQHDVLHTSPVSSGAQDNTPPSSINRPTLIFNQPDPPPPSDIPPAPEENLPDPASTTTAANPAPSDLPRRSSRQAPAPKHYGFKTALTAHDHDHPSYSKAMNGPER